MTRTATKDEELEKKIKELQDKNAKLEEAIKDAELDRKDILDRHKFKEAQYQDQIMEMSEGYSMKSAKSLKKKTRPKSAK